MRMRWRGDNGTTQLPSLFYPISITHQFSVFSFRPLPAFSLSVTRPQAVPLSRVLSQMWLFSLAPYFRRTLAVTRSARLREGLTEPWPSEPRPNVGCSQERLCLLVPENVRETA